MPVQILGNKVNIIYNKIVVEEEEYMMLNDKHPKYEASSINQKDVIGSMKEPNSIIQLKSLDFNSSSGYVCDINNGICGPVVQKKEGKE